MTVGVCSVQQGQVTGGRGSDVFQHIALAVDQRIFAITLPDSGRLAFDNFHHQPVGQPPRNSGILDPAISKQVGPDLFDIDHRHRAVHFGKDDIIDFQLIDPLHAGDLDVLDLEACFGGNLSILLIGCRSQAEPLGRDDRRHAQSGDNNPSKCALNLTFRKGQCS